MKCEIPYCENKALEGAGECEECLISHAEAFDDRY